MVQGCKICVWIGSTYKHVFRMFEMNMYLSFRIKAFRKNVLAKCVSKVLFFSNDKCCGTGIQTLRVEQKFVLAVWRWHNTEDEAAEEAGGGEKEDAAHRKGGSSQRRLHQCTQEEREIVYF